MQMKRYIKANQELTDDIVVTYRNKIIYDGPASVDTIEIFKNIPRFDPNNYEDSGLMRSFENLKEEILGYWRKLIGFKFRNGLVEVYPKEKFDSRYIEPKIKPDPNTAVVDGERLTAEELSHDIMLEADNYEYVYDKYQEYLSDYAKRVVENDWIGTSKDKVPNTAMAYVLDVYRTQHMIRKQNLRAMCYPFLREYMQEDYDRYKAEYSNSEVE